MADLEIAEQLKALQAEAERLRAEKEALTAELETMAQRLQFAASSAKLAWWDWDATTDQLTRFGAEPWFLGFAPQQRPMSSQDWRHLVHPDDRRPPGAQAGLYEGNEWTEEQRIRSGDGWRWVRNRARVSARDADGRPLRILGTTQDIHDEKVSAEARRLAEETTRRDAHALGQLQDAVVCTDVDLRITAWNRAAERIFQWTREEMLGRPTGARLPLEGASLVEGRLRSVLKVGQCPSCEWEDFRKDGSRVWMDWCAQALTDDQGAVVGTVSIGRDISERRLAELKRRELEQQLFHAQKLETMGLLAGGIAHDFNNILTVILMLAELGSSGMAVPAEEAFREIRKGGLRAKDLVRRILTFSRPSDPERKPIDVSAAVEDAAKFVRATLSTAIELHLELLAECPAILGDANQIQQVLINLASNAAFAMPNGGRLTIRVRESELQSPRGITTGELRPGLYLTLEVEDTGFGIPPDSLSKIFDAFFTTKAPGEGTGLGLPIVRGIAEEHGGGVDVASGADQGSLFTLYLPAISGNRRVQPSEAAQLQSPRGRGERVLVVDDEESIAILTCSVLEGLGYRAVHTTSPEAFLREFESNAASYDLIIVDHTMPRVTGLELAERVRQAGHSQPIIIATGFSGRVSRPAVERLRDSVLLEKPFEVAELAVNIQRLLEPRARAASA